MKLLLDTHVLIWLLLEPAKVAGPALRAFCDPENVVLVSAATAWEIAIKESIGKLSLPAPSRTWLPSACTKAGLDWLSITAAHALAVSTLPWHHRDPFDRMLVAQSLAEGCTLISKDGTLKSYGVSLLWT